MRQAPSAIASHPKGRSEAEERLAKRSDASRLTGDGRWGNRSSEASHPREFGVSAANWFRSRAGRAFFYGQWRQDVAVPKRKTSPMKRGFRRSADALKA